MPHCDRWGNIWGKTSNAPYLDVEEAAWVDVDPGGLLEVLGELVLVVLLDLHHLVLEPRVLGKLLQLGQLVQVRRPVLADLLAVNGKDMFKSR